MEGTECEVGDRKVGGVKPEAPVPRVHMVPRSERCPAQGLHWSGANSGGGGLCFLSSHTRKVFCIGVCQAFNFQLSWLPPLLLITPPPSSHALKFPFLKTSLHFLLAT